MLFNVNFKTEYLVLDLALVLAFRLSFFLSIFQVSRNCFSVFVLHKMRINTYLNKYFVETIVVVFGKLFPEVTAITKYINSKTSGTYVVNTINFKERFKENCVPLIN